jgi:hypothetical protein
MARRFLYTLAVAAIVSASLALAGRSADAALIVHYKFDGDTGTTAVDHAGGDHPLTLGTGSSFGTDPDHGTVLQTSNTQGASLSVTSSTQNYTIAGWYKGTDSGYWYDQSIRFIASVEASTDQDPADGGAVAGLGVYDNTWHNSAATSANDGDWHHLAWVFESDGLGAGNDSYSIYVDGVASDVDPGTPGIQEKRQLANGVKNLGGTQYLFSNAAGNNTLLGGLIDDVRIYDHALSAEEVAALNPDPLRFDANAGSSPTQTGWTATNTSDINNVTYSGVGSVGIQHRDRGTDNTDGSGADLANSDMWRDFVLAAGSGAAGEGLDITIDGLESEALYDVWLWAYDEGSGGDRPAIWTGSGLLGTSASLVFDGDDPDPQSLGDYVVRFRAQADELGVVVLEGRYGGVGGDAHNVFVNGFELTRVPEPTGFALVLLGLLGLAGFRWRRKR